MQKTQDNSVKVWEKWLTTLLVIWPVHLWISCDINIKFHTTFWLKCLCYLFSVGYFNLFQFFTNQCHSKRLPLVRRINWEKQFGKQIRDAIKRDPPWFTWICRRFLPWPRHVKWRSLPKAVCQWTYIQIRLRLGLEKTFFLLSAAFLKERKVRTYYGKRKNCWVSSVFGMRSTTERFFSFVNAWSATTKGARPSLPPSFPFFISYSRREKKITLEKERAPGELTDTVSNERRKEEIGKRRKN